MKYLYSTQPFLARCLNRYFFEGKHFVWASSEFYPYRLSNPASSSPLDIYSALYRSWKDRDIYDKTVIQFRENLRKGVSEQQARGVVSRPLGTRLKRVCKYVDIVFFYPIVYRIPATPSVLCRAMVAGSGLTGSSEYLIPDLDETAGEFDGLFLDFSEDADFECLLALPVADRSAALPILESRC